MSTISWLEIFDKYNTQEIIMGKILKKVPGGFIVNVFGTEGFLPGSQVPQSLKEKGEGIVNNDINFKLIKINAFANNIVVSRTEIFEQEKKDAYIEAMKDIHVGDIYDAVVKNIVSYGVFATINNKIDGLIPSNELSWQYVNDISQIVSINDTIKVKVIKIDESGKISLSMKQAEEKKERAPRHRQENKGPIRPADIDWSASSSDSLSFEDKLSKFKQDSDEKMQTLRRNNDSKRSGGYSRKNTHSF